MPLYYLDTSALLKRYRTEKGTDVVDEIFSAREKDELFITSHFTSVEVESVAARALKGRLLNKKSHGVLLSLFAEDLDERLILLPVSTSLLMEAAEAARNYSVRAGDAIHLASVLRAKQASAAKIVFVASDKELVDAGEAAGLAVVNPEDGDATTLLRKLRSR